MVTSGVYTSALEMFSIGIGPSSSHTVGPMRAAADFVHYLATRNSSETATHYTIILHGSLAATGIGHGTPDAVIAGLRGMNPETCDPKEVWGQWAQLESGAHIRIDDAHVSRDDIVFEAHVQSFGHPNAITLIADAHGVEIARATYLSVGGGFIQRAGDDDTADRRGKGTPGIVSTYRTASQLVAACKDDPTSDTFNRSIADIAMADEVAIRGAAATCAGLDHIWATMDECIEAGLHQEGYLPGHLRVPRRAANSQRKLLARTTPVPADEWLAVWAMAVNEENASGGRIVTAPTNGAAGVLPAILRYLVQFEGISTQQILTFLLTAAAVGSIIKANASISGAEAGCQGEIGSACAMAAAGITAVHGGNPSHVENAAEIAMEHHLGLTCDPVNGLVQIPCIERNAVAAATALTASRIALLGTGKHVVSLDTVIETMRQTGRDMSTRYKETSLAGLAVNVVEC
jgi:L-serine dehydratase